MRVVSTRLVDFVFIKHHLFAKESMVLNDRSYLSFLSEKALKLISQSETLSKHH